MRNPLLAVFVSLALIVGVLHADEKADSKAIDDYKSDPFKQYEREDKMRALAKTGTAEAATKLIELLADDYLHIRDAASDILIEMKGEAVPGGGDSVMLPLVKNGLGCASNAEIRWRSADILGFRLAKQAEGNLAQRMRTDKEVLVRQACARALGAIGTETAKKSLMDGLKFKANNQGIAGTCARALGQLGCHEAAEHADDLLSNGDWECVVGGIDCLALLGPDRALKRITKCASYKDWRVKIATAQCLARLNTAESILEARPALADLLKDSDWRVRRRSVEAMVDLWQSVSVELLIVALADEKTAIIHDIVQALELLTGQRKGYKADGWKLWWDQAGSKAPLAQKPKRQPQGWLKAPLAGQIADSGGGDTGVFFKVPVLKQNAAFVFDLSGSMRNPMSKSDPRIPIELAREELAKTLTALPQGAMFNVCAYRYTSQFPPQTEWLRAFSDGVRDTSAANVKAGNEWIAKLEVKGWGAFYEALTHSMDDPKVQAIYFLSDGAPSRGAFVRRENLLAALRQALRFSPVTINTVTISTKGRDVEFMQDIAKEGGGTCAEPLK